MNPYLYSQLIFNKEYKNIQWAEDSLFKGCWEDGTDGMQKNETRPLSYTKHKNKFKVDQIVKC